jgi:hypothetical protein
MRTFKFLSWIGTFTVLVIGILGMAGVIDFNQFVDSLSGGGGVVWAVATAAATITKTGTDQITGVVDTERTRTASSELLLNDISSAITIMRPDLYPLDTLLRRIGSADSVKSWEWDWYESDYRGWADTLAHAFDTSSSGQYSSSTHVNSLCVTNIHFWAIHDSFMLPDYADDDDDGPIVGIVVSKNTTTSHIGVIVINTVQLPDLTNGSRIIRMGTAKSELDAQTAQYGIMPQKTNNYVQIHMKQVEEGIYQRYHKKEVEWSMNDLKAAAMEDHRRGAEFTSWFGKAGKSYDPEADNYKYSTNGLIRYITKNIEFNETVSAANAEFLSITKQIFTGNAGSKTRFVFATSEWMEWLATVDTVARQRDAGSTKEIYGITFDKIQTNYGTLNVLYHQLLDDWIPGRAIQLDMNNLYRKEFKPLALRQVDLKSSGQRLTNATVIEEIFGLEVRYPLTHSILTPASS